MNRRRILQPLFAGVLLALGFEILWGIAVTFATATINQTTNSQRVRKSIKIRSDGTPLIVSGQFGQRTYCTLDGEPDHTLDGEPVGPQDLLDSHLPGASLTVRSPDHGGPWVGIGLDTRIRSFVDAGRLPSVFWYLVHDGQRDGTAYFIGYDADTKEPIGYLGLKGFREDLPAEKERFEIKADAMANYFPGGRLGFGGQVPASYRGGSRLEKRIPGIFPAWNAYFVSADRLFEIDLHERSVRVLLEANGLGAIRWVQPAMAPGATDAEITGEGFREYMAVRTADRVLVLDSEGTQQQSFAIPDGWHDRSFTFYVLGNDRAMLRDSHMHKLTSDRENTFVWIDPQGNVTKEKSVTFERMSMEAGWVAVPAMALVTPTLLIDPWGSVNGESFPSYWAALAAVCSHLWPGLLMVNLLGVALAILCYRRQKRFAQPHVWPWVVFVFLFGLPGMVGYLAHQRWPVREVCPECKQRVPRDRDACAACDEPFPQPELKGIEVLV